MSLDRLQSRTGLRLGSLVVVETGPVVVAPLERQVIEHVVEDTLGLTQGGIAAVTGSGSQDIFVIVLVTEFLIVDERRLQAFRTFPGAIQMVEWMLEKFQVPT